MNHPLSDGISTISSSCNMTIISTSFESDVPTLTSATSATHDKDNRPVTSQLANADKGNGPASSQSADSTNEENEPASSQIANSDRTGLIAAVAIVLIVLLGIVIVLVVIVLVVKIR